MKLIYFFIIIFVISKNVYAEYSQEKAISFWNLCLLSYCHGDKIEESNMLKLNPQIDKANIVKIENAGTHSRVLVMKSDDTLYVVCRGSDTLNLKNWISNILPGFKPITFQEEDERPKISEDEKAIKKVDYEDLSQEKINELEETKTIKEDNEEIVEEKTEIVNPETVDPNPKTEPEPKPEVHAGFKNTFDFIKDDVYVALIELYGLIMKKEGAQFKGVVVTGHSLGGAMTTFAAFTAYKFLTTETKLDLSTSGNKFLEIYSFGSPRVGNAAFAKLYNDRFPNTYRLVHKLDPVSFVPWQGIQRKNQDGLTESINYVHVGTEEWYKDGTDNSGQIAKIFNFVGKGGTQLNQRIISYFPNFIKSINDKVVDLSRYFWEFQPEIPEHVECEPVNGVENLDQKCYQGFLIEKGYNKLHMFAHVLDHLTYFGRSIMTDVCLDGTCGPSVEQGLQSFHNFISDLHKIYDATLTTAGTDTNALHEAIATAITEKISETELPTEIPSIPTMESAMTKINQISDSLDVIEEEQAHLLFAVYDRAIQSRRKKQKRHLRGRKHHKKQKHIH